MENQSKQNARIQKIRKNRDSRKGLVLLIILSVCVLLGNSFVIAKYLLSPSTEKSQVVSSKFYFTVDLMGDTQMFRENGTSDEHYLFTEDSTKGTWKLYGGGLHTISLNVQNFFDDLRINDETINFSVFYEVKKGSETYRNSNGITCTPSEGSLKGKTKQTVGVTLTIPEFDENDSTAAYEDGTQVVLTITSVKPYTKTYKLTFELYSSDAALKYLIKDSVNSPFAELIVMTGIASEQAASALIYPVLKWPTALFIDNTNKLTFTINSTGTIIQQSGIANREMQVSEAIITGRSESIFFFKSNIEADFSQSITVVENTGTEAAPIYIIDFSSATGVTSSEE